MAEENAKLATTQMIGLQLVYALGPDGEPVAIAVDGQGRILVSTLAGAGSALDVTDRGGRILGHVIIDEMPAVGGGGGGSTDVSALAKETTLQALLAELAEKYEGGAIALDATTLAALETITVANTPQSPETGLAKDATLTQTRDRLPAALAGDGGLPVHLQNPTGTQAVSGSFLTNTELRATAVPVSGPLTDTQLRAASVPVATGLTPLTDAQLRAVAVPVSGPLTDAQIRAVALPVAPADKAAVSQAPIGNMSLGNSAFKTSVMKTGNLVTTAVTADQVVLTYTVTAGKTFYLQYLLVSARLTTFAATATFFGALSLESPAATKLLTTDLVGTGGIYAPELEIPEPIPFAAGTVVRVVCTPSAATSFTWKASFGGYEK